MRNERRVPGVVCAALTVGSLGCADLFGGSGGDYGDGGADIVDPGQSQSGARLVARTLGHGAARHVLDFLDRVTDQTCTFRETPEHGLRCVPEVDGDLVYGDAGCTTAYVTAAGPFVTVREGVAQVEGSARSLVQSWTRVGDTCVSGAPRTEAFRVAELLPFDTMVHGIVHQADADVRLTRVGILAQDGAWQPSGWFDRELGFHCAVESSGDLAGKCLPSTRVSLDWTGGDCRTRPVATVTAPRTAWVTVYRSRRTVGACTPTTEVSVRALGEEIEVARPNETSATCSGLITGGAGPGAADPTWLVGEPLSALALADLAYGPSHDDTIGLIGLRTPDGRFGAPAIWPLRSLPQALTLWTPATNTRFDVGGETCQPVSVAGVLRCVPITATGGYYADEACTVPAPLGSDAGVATSPATWSGDASDVPAVDQVFAVGPQRASSALFSDFQGTCVPFSHPCLPPSFEQGEPLDPALFPELSIELR